MTDDLVKRLRDEHLAMTRNEAADRIEALERKLDEEGIITIAALGQAHNVLRQQRTRQKPQSLT